MRRPGLWVANGHPGNTVSNMLSWRPAALTCFFDYLGFNNVFNYKAANPDVPIIVRFQHPLNWHQDPTYFARQLGEQVASKWNDLKPLDPYVYFANEMNLHYENGDPNSGNQSKYTTPEFYKKYGNWVRMTAEVIKNRVPEMKLVTPPFAFGHHEDGAPDRNGHPTEGWAGYDYLYETVRDYFDNILTFHSYWGHAGGSVRDWLYDPELSSWYAFRWRRVLKLFEARYNIRAKMIIDEAGNFGASDPDFTDQIMYHARQCLNDARIIAVTYFLWLDPTHSPGNLPNSWVQNVLNLGDHLTRLKNMQEVPITEGEEEKETTIRVLFDDNTVRTMPVEEYLRAVVPAEIPALWSFEAVKAQAVASRSYALYAVEHPRHDNADICTNPAHCQNYRTDRIHEKSDEAILATKGIVARYNGGTVNALFSANCGGHTQDNEDVFHGAPLPYLRGVPCPDKGEKRGHSVGLCQYGARAFAQQGRTYEQIIKHYYTGVTLGPPTSVRTSSIYGTVVNHADEPVSNVTVVLAGPEQTAETTSRANGSYRFSNVPAGTYQLKLPDHQIQRNNITPTPGQDLNINVTLPKPTPQPAGIIKGTLRDASDQPVSNRRITLQGEGLNQTKVTDPSGMFRFENLPAGSYTIGIEGTDFSQTVTSNGQNKVSVTLRLSAQWRASIERGQGLPLLVGDIGVPNQTITITTPSGAQTQVISGSKPEFGPGGFEIYATTPGNYIVQFLGQQFTIPMNGQFTKVTFRRESVPVPEEEVRIISIALPRSRAEAIIQSELEADPDTRGLFEITTTNR